MPFLAEMFKQVSISGVNQNGVNRFKKRQVISRMAERYPTTQPAEGGLLQPRTVPKELRQFVNVNQLQEAGASGLTAKLKNNTLEGLRESTAVDSHLFATTNLRLANNVEIGVEVAGTLVSNTQKDIESLQELDLPDQAKFTLLRMVNNMTLLDKTVFDLKSTNNDFLKMSLAQYNQALQSRKEAWINSTYLPQGVKSELKAADSVQPKRTDPPDTRLAMLGETEVRFLQEHNQVLKDQLLMKSMQAAAGYQPRGRSRARGRSRGNGRGYQNQSQIWDNFSYAPRSRGRGRGSGRGRYSRPRGRGGSQQPFSDPQSYNKKE